MTGPLPSHLRGYAVRCAACGDDELFVSLFYDVAERFAETHEDSRGHETEIIDRGKHDD
jgi:hypothetical protein